MLWNPLLMATPTGGPSFGGDTGILVIQDCTVDVEPGLLSIPVVQSCEVNTAFDIPTIITVVADCEVTTDFEITTDITVGEFCTVVAVP